MSGVCAQFFLQAPDLAPVAACAALLLLITVSWSYSQQVRSLGRRWRVLLPLLRALSVVALAASMVKPVAVRVGSGGQRGSILVLVDRSRSMSIADNSRTISQSVALADALGKLPPGVRTDMAPGLSAALEHLSALAANVKAAQDDLDYARVSGRDIDLRQSRLRQAYAQYTQALKNPVLASESIDAESDLFRRLADLNQPPPIDAQSAWKTDLPARIARAQEALAQHQSALDEQLYQSRDDVRSACHELSRLSRYEVVQQALLRPGGILPRLSARAEVTTLSVAESVKPLPQARVDSSGATFAGEADGHQSDLTRCIAEAVAGTNVRAVVLFSDGRQVGGDPTVASGLVPGAIPVFTVAAAATLPPRDLTFGNIRVPSSVFAGQSFTVHVEVRHEGINKGDIEVHLEVPGQGEVIRKAPIREGRRVAVAEFPTRLSTAGAQKLRLWFPKADGEVSDANNHVDRWVKVVPRRMRVLLVAGSPGWDFQFVRGALARSPEIDMSAWVLGPGAKWLLPPADILAADVIVLFDPPAAAMDAPHWDQVEQFVERKGASVIFVAGSHLPAEFGRGAPIAAAKLLPWRTFAFAPVWRLWPGELPEFHFVPASTSQPLEALRLDDIESPAISEGGPSRWEELPGAYRFVQLPEPGDSEAWNRNAQPLLVESESRLPVLTEMRVGAGRAFFLGTDETWRWRTEVGDRDQDRFWRQLISYASDQPYFARTDQLALDVDRISVEPGQPVRVRARLTDERAAAGRPQELEILRNSKPYATRALDPAPPAGSGRFSAVLNLPEGQYTLRWSRSVPRGPAPSVQIPLNVSASDEQELSDLSGDDRMLRKIADATGGEFFPLEKVNALPDRVLAAESSANHFAQMPLWDSPYLFCLVIGCLGTEWALRKRLGLA